MNVSSGCSLACVGWGVTDGARAVDLVCRLSVSDGQHQSRSDRRDPATFRRGSEKIFAGYCAMVGEIIDSRVDLAMLPKNCRTFAAD
jgi:hypothetical protein